MKMRALALTPVMIAVSACNQSGPHEEPSTHNGPAGRTDRDTAPTLPERTAASTRAPLNGPKNAVDPKSATGARAVAVQYCKMLKSGHIKEARQLTSGEASNDTRFVQNWSAFGKLYRCNVGEPGQLEGAAGSIYANVPLEFLFNGGTVKLSGSLTLRRVNDVPGSSAEQRRWHITKFQLEPVD